MFAFDFIVGYPFKPPEIKFLTKIYHPNVNRKGRMCSHCLHTDKSWNPNIRIKNVIEEIIEILKGARIKNSLRLELAEGLCFYKNVKLYSKKIKQFFLE